MKKYLVIAFFLLIPFSPWIASWWHKRNDGSCMLDEQIRKEEEGKS